MGLMDLFIVDENSKDKPTTKPQVKQTETVSFSDAPAEPVFAPVFTPEQTTTPNHVQSTPIQVSNEYLQKAFDMYENGFNSLNKDGFDFYEFYQSVMHGGLTNPQVYTMAFGMGSAMDKTLTKDKLISDADYYVTEILKVYNDNVTKGNAKKQELLSQKESENKTLSNELQMMTEQLEALKVQIEDRNRKLSAIDEKYAPQLSEFDSKLGANELAKNKIVNSIEQVKQGITLNIK